MCIGIYMKYESVQLSLTSNPCQTNVLHQDLCVNTRDVTVLPFLPPNWKLGVGIVLKSLKSEKHRKQISKD